MKHRNPSLAGLLVCLCAVSFGQTFPNAPSPVREECNEYVIQHTQKENLTFKQRACLYRAGIISPSGVFGAAFFAGLSQAQRSPAEWGLGTAGYARRLGSNLGQSVAKGTGEFLASAMFHEDPRLNAERPTGRYVGSGWKRLGRSLIDPVYIPSKHRPRGGYLAGSFASGFAGMAWYPERQSHVTDALSRTGTAFGGYVISSVFSEFQSDIFARIGKLLGSR